MGLAGESQNLNRVLKLTFEIPVTEATMNRCFPGLVAGCGFVALSLVLQFGHAFALWRRSGKHCPPKKLLDKCVTMCYYVVLCVTHETSARRSSTRTANAEAT
jgi:hypothetical protein